MKRFFIYTIGAIITLIALCNQSDAANLMQVYEQALKSDPIFQSQRETYLSATQANPLARSLLMPTLNFASTISENNSNTKNSFISSGPFVGNNTFTSNQMTLTLTQPLVNLTSWAQVHRAKSEVAQAAAVYAADAQDLMIRVAQAYFNILLAQDTLRFTEADKRATERQLDQAKQRYSVGLDAITSVYDAQATYDAIVAEEIAAKNDVVNSKEQLRELTGVYYKKLSLLKSEVPLLHPNPYDVKRWVNASIRQNNNLLAARFAVRAAKENIHVNVAQHFPTVNAVGNYSRTRASNAAVGSPGDHDLGSASLEINFPIYQGGLVYAQTQQARYDYLKAVADMETTYRQIMVNTRQTYNNVIAGISKIKADKQAIISRVSSLESTEAALKVGTRTIVDLLQAQQELFLVQRNFAEDQYNYIVDTLTLKQLAGTLNVRDLEAVNRLLTAHPVQGGAYRITGKRPTYKILNIGKLKTTKKKIKTTIPASTPIH